MRYILIVLSLSIGLNLIIPDISYAACRFEWQQGAYCGSARANVPDRFFGPFTNACRTHDWCYFAAGEQIAKEIDIGYLKSIREISIRKRNTKKDCDSVFYSELSKACSQAKEAGCQAAAQTYFAGVAGLGWGAFNRSIDHAMACR